MRMIGASRGLDRSRKVCVVSTAPSDKVVLSSGRDSELIVGYDYTCRKSFSWGRFGAHRVHRGTRYLFTPVGNALSGGERCGSLEARSRAACSAQHMWRATARSCRDNVLCTRRAPTISETRSAGVAERVTAEQAQEGIQTSTVLLLPSPAVDELSPRQ